MRIISNDLVNLPEEENPRSESFSVVIPVEGRAALVERLLASLRQACIPVGVKVEILVVDSSVEPEAKIIRRVCSQYNATYLSGSRSVRRKRNQGAYAARHAYLLFLDSDCKASPQLFAAYAQFIGQEKCGAGLLAAGPTQFAGDETAFTRLIAGSSLLSPFNLPKTEGEVLWATTSNLLVSKYAFETVAGFEEEFPFRLGGDDTDLCLRLRKAGFKIIAVPDAVCFHSWKTWASPLSVVRRSFRWGWMQSILLCRHSQFRRSEAPGLPVYTLGCLLFSVIGGISGYRLALLAPIVFLMLAIVIHALIAARLSKRRVQAIVTDFALALVECPFGFGKAFGSLRHGNLLGILHRLGVDDSEMDRQFSETVSDLWSNNLALLATIVLLIVEKI
jgi:GT2 family glycosyltransferase